MNKESTRSSASSVSENSIVAYDRDQTPDSIMPIMQEVILLRQPSSEFRLDVPEY